MKQPLAYALCRVSSSEQLENNSLARQRDAVIKAADELGVSIPEKYWWSGHVSSKHGTNTKRKDLLHAIQCCKKDKRIGYIIVDEPDRFMRSIEEALFFEVTFRDLGVKVWYASDPGLNKGDLTSKLLKFTKYLSAEGSNEERQRKSINGQNKALLDGRYPFVPKPGYERGRTRGIPEVHPTRGPALKKILARLASRLVTPTQALIELNESAFMKDHSLYKMDKFRKIATDPFYAGIVEIHKQVSVRNVHGLHEPLITLKQHEAILAIFNGKTKNQSGPRKNGNPKYPCNNIVSCDKCTDKKNGRIVGLDLNNGKPNSKVYEKYRCRECKTYWTRDNMHKMISAQFDASITKEGRNELLQALDIVWKKREEETAQEALALRRRIKGANENIDIKVNAAVDPANSIIKGDLLIQIAKQKEEVIELEGQLDKLATQEENDHAEFLKFALDFINNMGSHFLEISQENRLRCKQIVFPAGFRLDSRGKVYTPEISPLYRLAGIKKARTINVQAHLVRVTGL